VSNLIDGGRVAGGIGDVGDAVLAEAGGMLNGKESSVIITLAQYAPLFINCC